MDIRIMERSFSVGGKTYILRCNMNVLADVQEASGGSIGAALRGSSSLKSVLLFLAAMLNDYADEQGWTERFTARQLGRTVRWNDPVTEDVMDLIRSSLTVPSEEEESDAEKN